MVALTMIYCKQEYECLDIIMDNALQMNSNQILTAYTHFSCQNPLQ